MAQKGNPLTIRNDPKMNFIIHNTKLWASLTLFKDNLTQLFFLKKVFLANSFFGFESNSVELNLAFLFHAAKTSYYKKKKINKSVSQKKTKNGFKRETLLTLSRPSLTKKYKIWRKIIPFKLKKANRKPNHKLFAANSNNSTLKNNCLKSLNTIVFTKKKEKEQIFSKLLGTYIKKYNYNNYGIELKNLNLFINKTKLKKLYKGLSFYVNDLFIRRYNFFLDFLKISYLFSSNRVTFNFFTKICARLFKYLAKRLHNKFYKFMTLLFKYLTVRLYDIKRKTTVDSQILGLRLQISGRLKAKQRASNKIIYSGPLPIQTINEDVDYSLENIITMYGVFGLKMWVYRQRTQIDLKSIKV